MAIVLNLSTRGGPQIGKVNRKIWSRLMEQKLRLRYQMISELVLVPSSGTDFRLSLNSIYFEASKVEFA